MNQSERLIGEYLAHAGYSDVVYEPDGKHPPDFLVDGRIAVEVRRLNQNVHTGGEIRGVEEMAVPLNRLVRKVLASISVLLFLAGIIVSAAYVYSVSEYRGVQAQSNAPLEVVRPPHK